MNDLIDRFWFWRRFGLPVVTVLSCAVLTLISLVCANLGDKVLAAGMSGAGGLVVGIWLGVFALKHQRPR